MNKKFIIIISVLVVSLIISIAAFGITGEKLNLNNPFSNQEEEQKNFVNPILIEDEDNSDNQDEDNSSSQKPISEKLNLTIEQISKLETNYECSFDIFQNGKNNTGKLYKSGNRVSLQYITIDSKDNKSNVNMIRGSQNTYIWDSASAFQFENTTFDNNELLGKNITLKPVNTKSVINFNCIENKPDDSYFILPENRKFETVTTIKSEVNKSVGEVVPEKIEIDRSICTDFETIAEANECNEALNQVAL
jgi:membrane-associated HD superfamily phosphohydrolase